MKAIPRKKATIPDIALMALPTQIPASPEKPRLVSMGPAAARNVSMYLSMSSEACAASGNARLEAAVSENATHVFRRQGCFPSSPASKTNQQCRLNYVRWTTMHLPALSADGPNLVQWW